VARFKDFCREWHSGIANKLQNTIVISGEVTTYHWYLKRCFQVFSKELLMSNSQSTPKTDSNDAAKTPTPGVAPATAQQNQGDKPASKPAEQQK
jgi:hypothetical protein